MLIRIFLIKFFLIFTRSVGYVSKNTDKYCYKSSHKAKNVFNNLAVFHNELKVKSYQVANEERTQVLVAVQT